MSTNRRIQGGRLDMENDVDNICGGGNPLLGLLVGVALAISFIAIVLALAVLCPSCATTPRVTVAPAAFEPDGTNLVPRAALVVHLTNVDPEKWNGWNGDCPGTDRDAAVVCTTLDRLGVPYLALANETATVEGVIAAAQAVGARVAPGGLLMLYFSGHGGQRATGDDEIDNRDETLCLWDGALLDDTVWDLLCKVPEGVRVWLVTDCCNSGTNYRAAPHDYASGVSRWWRRQPDLLHWGAAVDGTSAIGSWQGGFFTRALERAYKPGMTYAAWFEAAKPLVERKQRPAMNHTGKDFSTTEAFQ